MHYIMCMSVFLMINNSQERFVTKILNPSKVVDININNYHDFMGVYPVSPNKTRLYF